VSQGAYSTHFLPDLWNLPTRLPGVNHSASGRTPQAYDRAIDTQENENDMAIKIAKSVLMTAMVVASLTLFGALVLG